MEFITSVFEQWTTHGARWSFHSILSDILTSIPMYCIKTQTHQTRLAKAAATRRFSCWKQIKSSVIGNFERYLDQKNAKYYSTSKYFKNLNPWWKLSVSKNRKIAPLCRIAVGVSGLMDNDRTTVLSWSYFVDWSKVVHYWITVSMFILYKRYSLN